MEKAIPDLFSRARTGVRCGIKTSLQLLKFVIPLYIAVDLIRNTPLVDALGHCFTPMMKAFGLPGKAAFAFLAAFLLNNYAAIAILATLHLNSWQITQCGLMMGIAHELVVEGGVLKSTGTQGGVLSCYRLMMAVICGLLFAFVAGL
jgi:spore maturation protein SpmB